MTKPLEGVRVVELASYVFVPSAAAILGDWGAEVVKVEHPQFGDPARHTSAWGVPAEVNGVAHLWEAVNRGKRTVSVDVAQAAGREILMRLVEQSDVFLTNFLPAVRRKLRVEPDDVMAWNPRIVYGRGSATGPRGEECERGGFDGVTYWGRSGAAIGVTPPELDYPLSMPGPGFGDLQSGMALAGAIGAALYRRERSGTGVVVDVSLMSTGFWAMGMAISGTSVLDVDDLPRQGHLSARNPLVNQYRTKDGRFVALGFMQADRYWPEFCVLVDKVDWLVDERFIDSEARSANAEVCIELLDDLFGQRTLGEWRELLARQAGQWDVLRSPGELQHDEQARANGYVQRIEHGNGGKIVLVPSPAQFDGEAPVLGTAPRHGAHTDSVLRGLGLDADALGELRDGGVIG